LERAFQVEMADLTQMQPLYQDDLDKGEITFAELWQKNAIHLERMVATVSELPEKLGVTV
jgi:hypothetical protein